MNAKRISAQEYLKKMDTEPSVTIDLRTPAEHAQENLRHGVLLPVHKLDCEKLNHVLAAESTRDVPVYLLCQSGQRAELAVNNLAGKTNHELIIIDGGLNALKQCGVETAQNKSSVISLERQVRIAAGTMVLTTVVAGFFIHVAFYALAGIVGAGLMFAGITNTCGMAMVLARMPWNQKIS